MKKIFASIIALSAFAGPSMAADLYTPVPVAYDWSGAYLGGHLGYLWGDAKVSGQPYAATREPLEVSTDFQTAMMYVEQQPYPMFLGGASGDFDGLIGGIVGGWNFQSGNWVFGVEGDFGWTSADGGLTPNRIENGAVTGVFVTSEMMHMGDMNDVQLGPQIEMNWNAHVRGRVGVTLGEEGRTLLFVAGGLAIADADVEFGKMESFGGTFTGWSIGGGVNHAFDSNLIAGLEVLYDDYGSKSYDRAYGGKVICMYNECETPSSKVSLDALTVRGTLSYHFN